MAEALEQGIIGRWKQRPGRNRLVILKHFEFILEFVECSKLYPIKLHTCTLKHLHASLAL